MAHNDPLPTQRGMPAGIPAEVVAAGFEDPEEIGRGGFGVVYRCNQCALNRTVAVKVLTTDLEPDNMERFVREQVAMGQLSGHPHIVNIFQVGTTATGRPYIVMQYHPHGSLEAKIHETGPLDWRDALHIGVKVAGALETAHLRDTLHRDVKPANTLLTEYGEPQLTDFGIARISGGFETADGLITGSPAYTAPEILHGQPPEVTSDVYSLASTLFCAGTGHAVFERREGEQLVAQFLRPHNARSWECSVFSLTAAPTLWPLSRRCGRITRLAGGAPSGRMFQPISWIDWSIPRWCNGFDRYTDAETRGRLATGSAMLLGILSS